MKLNAFALGGYDPRLAKLCSPPAQARYRAVGNSIWLIGFLAFFGGMDIASEITNSWPWRIGAGLIWSSIIMRFDYMLIIFSKSNNAGFTTLRILTSLLIAVIVCPPVALMISCDKVTRALQEQYDTAIHQADSTYKIQRNDLLQPLSAERDHLLQKRDSLLHEGLTGHKTRFNDRKSAFEHDSLAFEQKKKAIADELTLLEQMHNTHINGIHPPAHTDYIGKVEMLFLLSVKFPFIGIIIFSLIGLLIIIESSALIIKAQTNRPEEEINVLALHYKREWESSAPVLTSRLTDLEKAKHQLKIRELEYGIRKNDYQLYGMQLEEMILEENKLYLLAGELQKMGGFNTSIEKTQELILHLSNNTTLGAGYLKEALFRMNTFMKQLADQLAAEHAYSSLPRIFYQWITDNVVYQDDHNRKFCRNAAAIFNDRRGVCSEMAILLMALCRYKNIDCFFAEVTSDANGKEVAHACVAFPYQGAYILVDPAYKSYGIDHKKWHIVADDHLLRLFTYWNN